MNAAGTIAGHSINAFAINEGTIVHVLSGTMKMSAGGTPNATRRASINDMMTIRLVGSNAPHRRVAAPGAGMVDFVYAVNASQRHAARLAGASRFIAATVLVRRRSAPGTGTMRFLGRNDLHARRAASALGNVALRPVRANAVRRQSAPGSSVLRFLHWVNLRAFAPIYGKDIVHFRQYATAVRRVGVRSSRLVRFKGGGNATARRQIITSSTIAFLSSIRMPHARMTPTEEIRALRILEDPRILMVPAVAAPLNVMPDDRTITIPESARDIGNPDNEDPA
ncbi:MULTISPECIES: hypothetical protein [unclassified Brucella]|uniref:hypothetical protein n=1 Tax=unclassified Brucella TaxID=2632610 RepID=UPI0012AD3ADB|nr:MULTISPECIES: hypothetical protein [unclassified Brucella]MRN43466.1 hypothetical protein [Brucella sp. 09RB8913]MRN59441.1 hypothetical protein [Brucella sp. 09RB8918]MRN67964.1 hypothetical protein [Brucella sp. 10RB9213]